MPCHMVPSHIDRRAARWTKRIVKTLAWDGSEQHAIRWWGICAECAEGLPVAPVRIPGIAAYGTGLSREAHIEAQEAGRLQREYEEAMPRNENRSIWK